MIQNHKKLTYKSAQKQSTNAGHGQSFISPKQIVFLSQMDLTDTSSHSYAYTVYVGTKSYEKKSLHGNV